MLWINGVNAADWALTPAMSMQAFYDDNLFLTTQNMTNTWGSVINASLTLSRKMETTSMALTEKISARHYDYNPMQDRNDNYIAVVFANSGERYNLNVNGTYNRESTLTSELADTGNVQVVRKVNQTSLSPQFSYQMSPRSTLTLAYDYLDKNYDAPLTEFSPYTTQTASANYTYALEESLQLQAVASHSKVDVPHGAYGFVDASLQTQTDNYQLGLIYDYVEDINLSVLYGKRDSQDEIKFLGHLVATSNSGGATYNVALTKTLSRGLVKLQLTRDYSPAGNGVVYATDNAKLGMHYRVDERNSFNLDISYIDQKPGTTSYTAVQRTYYSIQPGYTWQVAENWSLNAYYRYIHQKYDTSPNAAEANLLSLSMAYTWPYYQF